MLRWLIKAVFTRIFWLFVCSVFQRYLSHLNPSFKLFFAAEKKKCQGSVWQGAQLSTITPLHDIDMIMATRGERIKNSGAFHWHDHPSYPVKYNSMRNYFNVSQVNFRTKGWEIASHEEARRSEQPILYVRQTQLHSFRLPVNVSALHYFHVKPFP